MRKKGIQLTALLLMAVLLLGTVTTNRVTAQSTKRIGTVTHDEVRVRDGAGTVGTNTLGYLYSGAIVTILDQTTVGSTVWYKINCNVSAGNVTGWSSGDYIKVRDVVIDGTYEEYLASQGFPESYWDGLSTLHAIYPNWQFVAVETGLNWNDVVAAETRAGVKLAHRSSPSYYINWNDPYINTGRDGYYWVQASDNIIKYYLDPRNFLSDPYIFQFESQSYDADNHTIEGVENIIGHTFMKAANTFEADGQTYTHAQAIMEAAKISGASPLHLASRLRQEQGTTGSSLSFGTVSDPAGVYQLNGYYNYFNYGAYPDDGRSSLVNGAIYAMNVSETYYGPWTNPLRAIKGGSVLLGKNYINIGQDTVYFQCFNVVYKPSLYGHQYMTNVQVGETESQTLRNAYTDEERQNSSIVFKIPVYNNMPATPCTKTGEEAVSVKTDYMLSGDRASNISVGTDAATVIGKVTVTGGTASLYTASGAAKTSGTVATGDVLKIKKNDGSDYASYTVVLWGDVSGDGKINSADALSVQLYMVGRKSLSDAYLTAADASGDGKISSADALKIQLHAVERSPINQVR